MSKVLASIANWPAWAHNAFSATGTHAVANGTPATRGMLAVAVYGMLANGLAWYCGGTTPTGTCCGYHVGMLAYGTATVAYAKAGGTMRSGAAHKGITATSTPAQAAAQLAKAGFAPTIAVANGMLGTIANNTKAASAPLYVQALTAANGKAQAASTTNPVPVAYAQVPSAQPSKGYSLPRLAALAVVGKARTTKATKATPVVPAPSTPAIAPVLATQATPTP